MAALIDFIRYVFFGTGSTAELIDREFTEWELEQDTKRKHRNQ